MPNTANTPQIYVSILADYNNGEQRGEWIDATDADTMRDEIARILRTSKYPNVMAKCLDCDSWRQSADSAPCATCGGTCSVPSAEEYAIHDYDGFYGLASTLGEYPDLDTVAHVAAMIEEHGGAWALWAGNLGDMSLSSDDFQDAYCGEYDNEEAYASELVDEMGILNDAGATLAMYFDYAAYARDLFLDGYTFIDGHVFRSY